MPTAQPTMLRIQYMVEDGGTDRSQLQGEGDQGRNTSVTLISHSQYLATMSCILKTHNLVALANVLDYTAIQFFY